MNGRQSKKLRKIYRRNDLKIVAEFKDFVNSLSFWDRVRIAVKAVFRRM